MSEYHSEVVRRKIQAAAVIVVIKKYYDFRDYDLSKTDTVRCAPYKMCMDTGCAWTLLRSNRIGRMHRRTSASEQRKNWEDGSSDGELGGLGSFK